MLWTKAALVGTLGLVLGEVIAFATFFLARLVANDDVLQLSSAADWRMVAGHGVVYGIGAVIGVGVGALVRQTAGAISLLLVWTLLVENLVLLIPNVGQDIGRLMPFTNATLFAGDREVSGIYEPLSVTGVARDLRRHRRGDHAHRHRRGPPPRRVANDHVSVAACAFPRRIRRATAQRATETWSLGRMGSMAILVDPAIWPWRGREWAHLVSDTSYEELHAFAARLNIPLEAFQGDHYDVPADVRLQAIALGADEVDAKELVRRLRAAGLRRPRPHPPPAR